MTTLHGIARIVILSDESVVLSVQAGEYRDDNVLVINKGELAEPELFSQIAHGRKLGDEVAVDVEIISPYDLKIVSCIA